MSECRGMRSSNLKSLKGKFMLSQNSQSRYNKQMRRRNSYDIFFEILNVVSYGASKTKIGQSCNLNHYMLDRYVRLLLKNGLIASEDNDRNRFLVYKITPDGIELLNAIYLVRKLLLGL